MNFVDELRWRGMIHTMMPGTEELLKKEMVTAYLGIDPTADSLHIGHLCGVMMLRHFQRCGHKPLALVGGATGMIGDPSGKSQERNLLDEETLRHNQECIKNQLGKFLDFESDAPNRAELVNNYDWMKDFSFLDFARTVGKHITVNYMMAKESVQKRLNGEARDGLSFTEFTYQLLQGYDAAIELSEKYRFPLLIHAVKATVELLVFQKKHRPTQPWIIHGFRGKKELAEDLLRHGFYLSFGKKYQEKALSAVPVERLLLESDEAHLDFQAFYSEVASTRGTTVESLIKALHENANRLFFNR